MSIERAKHLRNYLLVLTISVLSLLHCINVSGQVLTNQSLPQKRVWAHVMNVFPPYSQYDAADQTVYYRELYPLELRRYNDSSNRGLETIPRMKAAGVNGMQFWMPGNNFLPVLRGWLETADGYPGFLVAPCYESDSENDIVEGIIQYAAAAANHPSAARIDGKFVIYLFSAHGKGKTLQFWQNVRRRLREANVPTYFIADTGPVSWVFERANNPWIQERSEELRLSEFEGFYTFGSPDQLSYFGRLIDLMNSNNKTYAGGVNAGYNRETPGGGFTSSEATLYFRRNWEADLDAHIQWQNIATWNDFTEHTEIIQTSDWNWTQADLNAFYSARLGALPLPARLQSPQLYVTSPQHTRLNSSPRAEALVINSSNQTLTARLQLVDGNGQAVGSAFSKQIAPNSADAVQIPDSLILNSYPAKRFLRARATMLDASGTQIQSVLSAPIVIYDNNRSTDLRLLYYSIPAYKALPGTVGLTLSGSPLTGSATATVTPPANTTVRFSEALQNTRQVENMFNRAPASTTVPRAVTQVTEQASSAAGFYVGRVIDENERVGYSDPIFVSDQATPQQPDLVVTNIFWTPSSPAVGQAVTFSATIKNQGTAATPNNVIQGVGYFVNGQQVSCSGTYTNSIAAGESITLTADGCGQTWTAGNAESYSIDAFVDDANRFAESDEANNHQVKTLAVGTGTGLMGEYYDNADLTNLKTTRTDASVNFSWETATPTGTGLTSPDTFSVRWSGRVQALVTGTYTFTTTSDDGVRLWVNNQQIINNWTDHSATDNSGTINLTAGQKYNIQVEYYDRTGGATAKLSWSYPGQTRQIVPQSRLYPSTSAVPVNLIVNPGFENGVGQTPTGWSTWSANGIDDDADFSEASGQGVNGSAHGEHWKTSAYEVETVQTVTNLAAGMYTLKARVKSSGGQQSATMYAGDFGGVERVISLPTTNSLTEITISDINVSNGQCKIGFYSKAGANQWIQFDNVQFYPQ